MNDKYGTYRIMLVDDEVDVLKALTRTLRRAGFDIVTFSEPEKALQYAKNNTLDLVISDYRMPGMDGVSFLKAFKQLQPSTVSIVLSGYTDMRAVLAAINEVGIYKYLTKPWSNDELNKIVSTLAETRGDLSKKPDISLSVPLVTRPHNIGEGALAELENKYPGITQGVWSSQDKSKWVRK